MRIGIIGGVERSESAYRQVAELAGHTLAYHSGHMQGRGTLALSTLIKSVGLLIVITDVNSHGAVTLAEAGEYLRIRTASSMAKRKSYPQVIHSFSTDCAHPARMAAR